ncbi:MAG TPA: PH domain-containing protein [Casimicrobiaceae bacterium]|nr:PH domain-containing protein [Casimicrobiaceae bacterium]
MSYVSRNLLAGEKVVYRTRLFWLLLAWPVVFLIVVAVAVVWLATTDQWNDLAWIPLGVAVLILLGAIIKRQSSDFAVTNKRVLMKVGVFSTRSTELFLNKIEAIAVHQSLAGRMLHYGDIVITGSGGTHEEFHDMQSPLTFRRAVQTVTDAQIASPRIREAENVPRQPRAA